MSVNAFSKRENHIKSIFLPDNKSEKKQYLPEEKVLEIIKKISSIGERYGFVGNNISQNEKKALKRSHKYDVWIAKEIKKNLNLINEFEKIRLILDWAIQTTANIFLYSFDDAYNQQDLWHKELFKKYNIEKINIPEIDNRRILYRCSNKSNFIYLLEEKDLAYEGAKMGTCVGGKNYKSKIKNNISTIISIRDKHNIPHVTIEIYNQTNTVTQIYGKGNSEISEKYKKIILEFILFATDYENMENKRLIEILNIEKTL